MAFPCPFLRGEVELTEEREQHIAAHHPDLLPKYRRHIVDTLASPDLIRRSVWFGNARLFSRWYPDLRGGKHVVVVVSEFGTVVRHWIITAYIARKLEKGEVEWRQG